MKKRGIIAIVITVVAVVLIIIKLSVNKKIIEENKEVVDRSHIPVTVRVAPVEMLPLNTNINHSAIVEPNEIANVAPSASGKIESLSIELGTKVSKGQVIGKIDTKSLDIQKESLQLTVNKLKRDYERNKDLFEGNALSETQYLDSKYAYESRQLDLKKLKQQIDDSYIKSPLTGTITGKNNLKGEFVSAGTPIATVVATNLLKIYVFLNQSEVRFIDNGDTATITTAMMSNKEFKGKVTYIAPNADNNYNYKVEVQVNNKKYPDLRTGTYVNVKFNITSNQEVLQIPKKALVGGIKDAYVFVQNGDRAEKRNIHVGRDNGQYIEVVEGLKANEKVVIDGQINIVDNSLIQAKESK